MKKILGGCLIVIVVAMIGFGVAAFYAYRAMKPVIDNASSYMDKARVLEQLGEAVNNKSSFVAPESGELTNTQVERFLAVQTRVRSELDEKWNAIEKGPAGLSELATLWIDARKAQVNALNVQRFSEAEYQWVRRRVYEAAGVHLVNMDLSKIEELARDAKEKTGMEVPEVDLPKIPGKNIELVKPHTAKVKEWIPMAALGL